MSAEPQTALSVRISGKTKRYLDALAEKKGVGVGKVLDQIVAELENTPDEAYYLRSAARMGYLTNFYLRLVMNRTGLTPAMDGAIGTVRAHADALFGPPLSAPEAFKGIDITGVPNEFAAMYAAFGLVDPTIVKPDVSAAPSASGPGPAAGGAASGSTATSSQSGG